MPGCILHPLADAPELLGHTTAHALGPPGPPRGADVVSNQPEGRASIHPTRLQLLDEHQEHVELADGAEPATCFLESPLNLHNEAGFEPGHREELPKAARGDACPVNRSGISRFEPAQRPRKSIQTGLDQILSPPRRCHD
jgi:hypothetical protein